MILNFHNRIRNTYAEVPEEDTSNYRFTTDSLG